MLCDQDERLLIFFYCSCTYVTK